jgi:sorbitol-specific phosphotransferase system component IIC
MYQINKKVLKTPVTDGGILLLQPDTGLYFELNDTSVLVYEGIASGKKKHEIIKDVLISYDVTEEVVFDDVNKLYKKFLKEALIFETDD